MPILLQIAGTKSGQEFDTPISTWGSAPLFIPVLFQVPFCKRAPNSSAQSQTSGLSAVQICSSTVPILYQFLTGHAIYDILLSFLHPEGGLFCHMFLTHLRHPSHHLNLRFCFRPVLPFFGVPSRRRLAWRDGSYVRKRRSLNE